MERKKITIVIPVYNEEKAFENHFNVIQYYLASLENIEIDVLIVNDGSSDNTDGIVYRICQKLDNVTLLSFTRNFGKESAIHAGLEHAKGDAIIVMDSDLQHPPELISQMISRWIEGALIVEAYKFSRGKELLINRLLANGFYKVFNNLSGMDLRNKCDFKLLDRKVVEAYKTLPERGRFFRGIVHWLGFPTVRIPFEVPERVHGGTSWSRLRLAALSISAITSFSVTPLQFVTILGLLTFSLSIIFGGIAIYDKITGHAVSGFTTVILLILIIGSILMFSIGLMGVYIARIYAEIKGRPGYIIKPRKISDIKK